MTQLLLVLPLIKFILRYAPGVCMAIPVQSSSENRPSTGQDLHPISPQPRHTDWPIPSDRAPIPRMGSSIAFKIDSLPG